jgi:hypothetical protein
MNTINSRNEYKTLVAKGKIQKGEYVIVTNPCDHTTYCKVKNSKGDEEEYKATELMGFAILEKSNTLMDIIEDGYGKTDKNGNKDVIVGHIHISPNVRSGLERVKFWEDCRYSGGINDYSIGYRYPYKELSDEEVIDILLNEILYDYEPTLQSTSLVGTTAKGIDKDPNYHNGNYFLNNDKEYTMTYCGSTVKIREGRDGGWYQGTKEVGRTIYEGKVDYQKIKQAMIKRHSVNMLSRGRKLFDLLPEVQDLIINHIKDDERFKLNSEF